GSVRNALRPFRRTGGSRAAPRNALLLWIVQLVEMVPTPADEATDVPFMNQIAVLPLLSRHNRSLLPSPLKSRWPTIDQAVGMLPMPLDDELAAPFISQSAALPLESRQAMSLQPSLLKSWVVGSSRTNTHAPWPNEPATPVGPTAQ